MRKLLTGLLLVVAVTFSTTGCDFIRSSLGKPTSADLAVLRMERDAREQAVRDSVAAVEAERARLEAEAAAEASKVAEAASIKRYYAVAGAFKEASGAQAYIDKLQENGYKVRTFDFKSGLKVVCLEGSDSLSVVRKDVAELKARKLFPGEPWIYNTNQKLHKEI